MRGFYHACIKFKLCGLKSSLRGFGTCFKSLCLILFNFLNWAQQYTLVSKMGCKEEESILELLNAAHDLQKGPLQ